MERERCAQQRNQESLLAAICKSLKDEHQAELQRSQRQMAQVQKNQERNPFQTHGVMWLLRKADLVCSVVTAESEDSAAAREGRPAGGQRSRQAAGNAKTKGEQP